ncbi:MAG: DUF3276 family protein [Bacteroidetes bacterium]|nr:DUF3276 family protein [Bacteroidota bacterium]MDA1121400.1 DUF3276 family protein [Bacteroidota bacterium]
MEENNEKSRDEIFSERVRAGKRTYFFDIKATRSNDYYLTITESKRRFKEDGFVYEKHKIFLYKEDFDKFINALNNSVDHVKTELLPGVDFNDFDRNEDSTSDHEKAELTTDDNPGIENEVESEEKAETEESGDSDLKWE